MSRFRQCSLSLFRAMACVSVVSAAGFAVPVGASSAAATEPPPQIDAPGVARWADDTFDGGLARKEFSGLVVSVVRDGEVIFSKGYGRADFAQPGPVDPARTQIRIGSVTKTFTASLLQKLVEDGRVGSIDEPVNRYLRDYALPANDGIEITLHHLVTHTAGFEDRFYGIGADTPTAARLPADEFDALRPAYVRPAGSRIVYSNFGLAVLGRVIEDVTGLTIDDAMRSILFEPLGMSHTRLLVDVQEPATLGKPATIDAAGQRHETPFTAINPAVAAAGSIVSTGDDMAKYMMAQLRASRSAATADPVVLSGDALQALHTRRAGNAPETTGVGMVFFDEKWGDVRTVAHGGNWTGFHSWMTLIPELDTGIFIGVMGEPRQPGTGAAVLGLIAPWVKPPASPAVASASGYANAFLVEFLGERRPLPASPVAVDARDVAGWYRLDRRVFSTAESVADLLALGNGVLRVDVADGALTVAGAGPWHPAGNGVFILDAPTRNQVVIRPDARTGATVLVPDLGIYTFTRIPASLHPRLHAYVIAGALVVCFAMWLVLIRTARAAPVLELATASTTTVLACALPAIAFAAVFGGKNMMEALYAGHVGPLALFVSVANALVLAALATLVVAAKSGARPRLVRGALYAIAISGLAIGGLLAVYNVLGWRVPA